MYIKQVNAVLVGRIDGTGNEYLIVEAKGANKGKPVKASAHVLSFCGRQQQQHASARCCWFPYPEQIQARFLHPDKDTRMGGDGQVQLVFEQFGSESAG